MIMNEKILLLLQQYDHEMFKLGVDPEKCENYCGPIGAMGMKDDSIRLSHIRWMIHQMQDRVTKEEWSDRKINRWLGFIQGVLWCTKLRGILELRDESRDLYNG